MTELQRELLAVLQRFFDPRWWVLGLLVWATRDLVLQGKLSGDAWGILLTLAGAVMGVAAVAASPTAKQIIQRLDK